MGRLRGIGDNRVRRRAAPAGAMLLAVCAAVASVATGCGSDEAPSARRAAAAPSPARCTPPAAGSQLLQVEDGRAPVLLHVPPSAPPRSGRWPLVLHLPGAGQDGPFAEAYTGYSALADQEGFMVAYPTAAGQSPFWNVSGEMEGKPDDVAYLRRVIITLTGPPTCADPDRVTVTGASNGGGMSAVLACAASDLLAAAAPVAGGYSTLPPCRARRPLPILELHSLTDPVVPYEGKGPDHAGAVATFLREWRRRNGCRGPAHRTTPVVGIAELRWRCTGAPVVHDRLASSPHGWYGGSSIEPTSTTARTWRFLRQFRRR